MATYGLLENPEVTPVAFLEDINQPDERERQSMLQSGAAEMQQPPAPPQMRGGAFGGGAPFPQQRPNPLGQSNLPVMPPLPFTQADELNLQKLGNGLSTLKQQINDGELLPEEAAPHIQRIQQQMAPLLEQKSAKEQQVQQQAVQAAMQQAAMQETLLKVHRQLRSQSWQSEVASFTDPVTGQTEHFYEEAPGKWKPIEMLRQNERARLLLEGWGQEPQKPLEGAIVRPAELRGAGYGSYGGEWRPTEAGGQEWWGRQGPGGPLQRTPSMDELDPAMQKAIKTLGYNAHPRQLYDLASKIKIQEGIEQRMQRGQDVKGQRQLTEHEFKEQQSNRRAMLSAYLAERTSLHDKMNKGGYEAEVTNGNLAEVEAGRSRKMTDSEIKAEAHRNYLKDVAAITARIEELHRHLLNPQQNEQQPPEVPNPTTPAAAATSNPDERQQQIDIIMKIMDELSRPKPKTNG